MESLCKGRVYNKQFPNDFNETRGTMSYFDEKVNLDPEDVAFPCGFLASNFPGDRFKELSSKGGETIKISVDDLLNMDTSESKDWKDGFNKQEKDKQWTSVEDPLFRNWMVKFTKPTIFV